MNRVRALALALGLGLALVHAPGAAAAPDVVAAPPPRDVVAAPPPRDVVAAPPPASCTTDGALCIAAASYVADVCGAIEALSLRHGLDPHFFARVLWKESLFDAGAVSPAGAQGIAQFMPDTARLRGLADPFNPAAALDASAAYLADLDRAFGNIGLAAVAYNGGEARATRYVAGRGGLPLETRAYVHAITGHSAETWRDAPPAAVDLALAPDLPFHAACLAHAARRAPAGLDDELSLLPWGVILASSRDRTGAERQVSRLKNRHAAVLGGEPVAYARARLPGMPRRLYNAQVGRNSRAEADALCQALRASGGACMVLRN